MVSRFGSATMARLGVLISIIVGAIFTILLGVADFSKSGQW